MTPEVAAGHVERVGYRVTGPATRLTGGHLNEVFRVPTSSASVVLKHAPPYVAAAPEVPLDPDRLRHEALGLAMGGTLWRPGRVPELLVYDPVHQVLCLEDLGDRPHLGTWLASAGDDAAAALLADVGRHLGQLHRAPADAEAWANPDVQATRHELQYRQVPGFLEAHGHDRGLGAQALALGEALQRPGRGPIMGDLWLSSVLVEGHDWSLIDWELSHWGQPLQDVAHLRAHLFLVDPTRAAPRVAAFEQGYRATAPPWDGAQHDGARIHEACELLARTVGAFPMMGRNDSRWSAALERSVALLEG